MKFTVNTKPLKNVTSLGIIKANISNYYYRSGVIQITASRDTLVLNIEASGIKTKMTLRGSGDEDRTVATIVDCAKFKQLIDSIDSAVLSIEFIDGGIYVKAGNSKFTIPQTLDVNDVQLDEPTSDYVSDSTVAIKPAEWQFVKDHQMYALSKSKEHPVYTNVWIGADGKVIVGDIDLGRFTYSHQGTFDTTCLLPASLINLLTSIPENSLVSKAGKSYLLSVETDSYTMVTEFTPKYEDDEAVGSYNSNIILSRMSHPESFITINVDPIIKFINQTSILNQSDLDKILDFVVADNNLTLSNRIGSYSTEANTASDFSIKFDLDLFKGVISNFDSDEIHLAPMFGSGTDDNGNNIQIPVGCIFWTEDITTILAGGKVGV